ncbi:hypothetical protein QQF64_011716 [Cirrhinus molitorella]|uniref:Uncharacterized protein n=1 Tax=Cirrhinus molitorella TaxID=172907 RepID=A0ABR3M016_9TELE
MSRRDLGVGFFATPNCCHGNPRGKIASRRNISRWKRRPDPPRARRTPFGRGVSTRLSFSRDDGVPRSPQAEAPLRLAFGRPDPELCSSPRSDVRRSGFGGGDVHITMERGLERSRILSFCLPPQSSHTKAELLIQTSRDKGGGAG